MKKIHELMTHHAECTHPEATLQEAATRMRALDVGALPICDNDRLVGMVTDRDIAIRAVAEGCDPSRTQVREVMSSGVTCCFEDQDISEAVDLMERKQIRRLVVLNRDRRLAGILSIGDVATRLHDDRLSGEALCEVSEPSHPHR